MFSNLSNNFKGILLAFIGFSAFALGDTSVKYVSGIYDVFTVLAWNGVFAMLYMLIFSRWLGGWKRTIKTPHLKVHIGRALCNTATGFLIVYGLSMGLELTIMYAVLFVTPFISTVLAIPIFKERVTLFQWAIITCGFAGVLIVLHPWDKAIDIAVLMPLAATIFLSLLFLLARFLDKDEPLLSLGFYPLLNNLFIGLTVSLAYGNMPALEHMPYFMLNGGTLLCGLVFTSMAFRIGKTASVSPVHYTQILWGVFYGYFFFGNLPDFWTIAGATVIIGSGLVLIWRERKQEKAFQSRPRRSF